MFLRRRKIPEHRAVQANTRAAIRGDWSANCKNSVYVWTEEDYAALNSAAAELGTSPEDLLLVMELESGRNPHRAFCNSKGYPDAVGLNQITNANAKAMRITEEERVGLLEMSAAEQLPFVVRSFMAARGYKPFPTPPDAVTLYQTNIAPATVGRDTVYRQKVFPCPPAGSTSDPYCNNPVLDPSKDGVITRDDLAEVLRRVASTQRFQTALSAYRNSAAGSGAGLTFKDAEGRNSTPESEIISFNAAAAEPGVSLLFLGGVAAAGIYYLTTRAK